MAWFSFFSERASSRSNPPTTAGVQPTYAGPSERRARRARPQLEAARTKALALMLRTEPTVLANVTTVGDWRGLQVQLQGLKELPALRSQAQRFAHTLDRDYCLLDDVVATVGRDPALTVNVLRLANSAMVGARGRVDDLMGALQLLGVTRVRLLAQTLAAMHDARGLAPGFDWAPLWLHSAACASLAERLSRWAGMKTGAELQLAALLHDVGKIALSAVAPQAYRMVLVEAWQGKLELTGLEQAKLGLDHREAGWIFGQEAELPPGVLQAIAHHDAPERAVPEHRGLVAAVGVANRLSKHYGLGFSGDVKDEEMDLAAGPLWRSWEIALGRKLDASALETLLEEEWIDAIAGELEVLGSAGNTPERKAA